MPKFTKKLQIPYFYYGDQYSAYFDKLRFYSIDSYLNGLSSILGDGVIDGLSVDIIDQENLVIRSGSAIINKQYYVLKSDIQLSYSKVDGAVVKLQNKSKRDFNDGLLNNITYVSYNDSVNPSVPSNIKINEISYYKVSISWELQDADISTVNIYRDNYDDGIINFNRAALVESTYSNSYVDVNVFPGYKYIYYLETLDVNGNKSVGYSYVEVSVPEDNIAPDPPKFLSVISGVARAQLIWNSSSQKNVTGYEISYVEIDSTYSSVGEPVVILIDKSYNNYIINDIDPNTRYKFSIRSFSASNKYSTYYDKFATTKEFGLPDTIVDISYSSFVFNENIFFDVSWNYSLDPYENSDNDSGITYKYKIYELDNLNKVSKTSEYVEISNNNKSTRISGYPVLNSASNTVSMEFFVENKRYLFGIFRFKNSQISTGTFSYFNAANFLPPDKPSSVSLNIKEDRSMDVLVLSSNNYADVNFADISIYSSKILNKISDYSSVATYPGIEFKIRNTNSFSFSGQSVAVSIPFEDLYELFIFTLADSYLLVEFNFEYFDSIIDSTISVSIGGEKITSQWPEAGVRVDFSPEETINDFFYKVVAKLNVVWLYIPGVSQYKFTDMFNIDLIDNPGARNKCNFFIKFNKRKPSLNSRQNSAIINNPLSSALSINLDWTYPEELTKIKYIYTYGEEEQILRKKIRNVFSTNINSSVIRPGYRYRVEAKFIDIDGNESESNSSSIITPMFDELDFPLSPPSQTAYFMYNRIMLSWNYPKSNNISYFKIYKKIVAGNNTFIDVGLIARLKSDNLSYQDYDIESGKAYYYSVASEDAWGRESLAYQRSSQFNSTGIVSVPDFSSKNKFDFNVIRNGSDVNFSWEKLDLLPGDGIEIVCKNPKDSEFKAVYNSNFDIGSAYVKNIFIDNGMYVFGIRNIYNQIDAFIDYSGESFGLEIAKINYKFNILKLSDLRRQLYNLESPILEETDIFLSSHNHLLTEDIDKRIDLSEVYRVVDWNSFDDNNSIFFTESDFPNNYTRVEVYLNKLKNIVLYELDYEGKKIVFSKSLWPKEGQAFNPNTHLFTSKVSIDVVFLGFAETVGSLQYNQFGSLFAEQFDKGILDLKRIDNIEHSGRKDEDMHPLYCICESDDGYKFIISRNEDNKIRYLSGNTAYDISDYGDEISDIPNDSTRIGYDINHSFINCHDILVVNIYDKSLFFFACSDKIYYAYDLADIKTIDGSEGRSPFDFGPSTKLFYKIIERKNIMLSLHPRGFSVYEIGAIDYLSNSVQFSLLNSSFIDGVSFCHDAIFVDNVIYISTNIGVYQITLSFTDNSYSFYIIQMPIISIQYNEVFSVFVFNGDIHASTSNGIYRYNSSFNSWILESISSNDIIHKIIDMNDYILLVGKYSIFRLSKDQNFNMTEIYRFTSEIIQSGAVFQDRLVISTDRGLYISLYGTSLQYSDSIKFQSFATVLKINGNHATVFSLKSSNQNYGEELYICQEGRVSRAISLSRISTLVDFHYNKIGKEKYNVPSYYINNDRYESGIYVQNGSGSQNLSEHCSIYSKYRIDITDELRLVRSYKKFYASNGGWAYHDFASPVGVKLNGMYINDGSRAVKPYNEINDYLDLNLNNFDDRISNLIVLESNFNNLYNHIDYMTTNTVDATGGVTERGIHRFTRNNIRKLLFYINKVNSSIYSPEISQEMGIYNSLYLNYPIFKVYLLANVYANTSGYEGVSVRILDNLNIGYSDYSIADRDGSLCTYDPEDKSYYLPSNIPLKDVCSSSVEPNYDLSTADLSFGLSDDISALNDYFASIIPEGGSTSTVVGRNRGGSDNPTSPPGGTIGGGGSSSSSSGGGIGGA